MIDTSNAFDWQADQSIAVAEQPRTAVYPNDYEQVVLRRKADWDEESDGFVYIARENVLTIVRAILVAAGMEDLRLSCETDRGDHISFGYDIDWPPGPFSRREAAAMVERPDLDSGRAMADFHRSDAEEAVELKDRTAAQRQRRRRQRLRDERDNGAVTGVTAARDKVTEEAQLRLIAAE